MDDREPSCDPALLRAIARGNRPAALPAGDVSLIDAAGIRPEPVAWLWPGWLARGKVHILAGAPGTGKTTLALSLAAALTTGGRWPDGTHAPVADVVVWSGEDDARDTLIPRLLAAGADRSRVRLVGDHTGGDRARPFDPASDLPALSDALAARPPALLIVDPVVSAVSGDSHKNAEVRRALQPLVDLAILRRCAVVGVTHLSKGTAGRDPVERVTGSLAFGALARVVLMAAKLPDDQGGGRVLVRAKSNIGSDVGGFRYDMEPHELERYPGVFTVRLTWGAAIEGTARDIMGQADATMDADDGGAVAGAVGFLQDLLSDGPMAVKQIGIEANGAGYSWATVRRAKDRLKVEARKDGYQGKWQWALMAEGAHHKNMSAFGHDERLWTPQGLRADQEAAPNPKVLKDSKGAQATGCEHLGRLGTGSDLVEVEL